ncbi:uncharacterized protein A1O9_12928 [Exophiala aquamarina CBS 119918]|uniref:Zn(2)-C6 fungal-type domain-containing protein n=1 Tax=Exophiala aquamarina CBS 119918 TaxID=1182545 RepID=A0A072NUF0_9EURO|nr:uncharacterized protein A1O9_12928 [Exophiala aquamarina CBS 119918]KEF51002.1 hypothetical protein A1O9_12928 [Exophiala aquamarina CBS 119918]
MAPQMSKRICKWSLEFHSARAAKSHGRKPVQMSFMDEGRTGNHGSAAVNASSGGSRYECDEERDAGCGNCRSRSMKCDFDQTAFRETTYMILPKQGGRRDAPTPRPSVSDSAVMGFRSNSPLSPLRPALLSMPAFLVTADLPESMTPFMHTLQHFDSNTYSSMGSDMGQKIVKTCVYTIAIETPHLMHALHGVAATHLGHLLPASQHPVQNNQSKLAAAYHWQRCIQLFRAELQAGPTRQNMDALISTIMLIATHQFMLSEPCPDLSQSFVFAPADQREARLTWLFIASGFQGLWSALGDNIEYSVWLPVLQDSDLKNFKSRTLMQPSGDETHDLFLELCEAETATTAEENPYYPTLESLLYLRRMSPSKNAFNKLVNFLGVIDHKLHRRLIIRDKRALLILAHWLGLMCEIQQWWISGRSQAECLAITTFLMDDPDIRVRKLLEYPARIAGIAAPTS